MLSVKLSLQILVSKVFKETILEQYFLIEVLLNFIKWKLSCKKTQPHLYHSSPVVLESKHLVHMKT